MKRGLVLTKYGSLAAATRQRFMQAVPYLTEAGIELTFEPLFDNAYLEQLFNHGKRSSLRVAKAYAGRLKALLSCKQYDFVWVHIELFPYLPLEGLIGLTRKPVIFDYDDAIFHQYDQHPEPLVRQLLSKKLQPLLKHSNIAFCGNAYLRDYAARYCPRTEIIPTTVDVNLYVPDPNARQRVMPVVGWIGSPSTWKYCAAMGDTLAALVNEGSIAMLVVGANHTADHVLPFEYRAWAEEREVTDIRAMDIGIMPIPDEPWARGKCGYKLIQYMAFGLPVIASPVGVNTQIVQHGVNGFLASTDAEWRDAILQLANDPALRARMGAAGRKAVEERYSIQQFGPRMAELIHSLF